jgi:hypothetical protein
MIIIHSRIVCIPIDDHSLNMAEPAPVEQPEPLAQHQMDGPLRGKLLEIGLKISQVDKMQVQGLIEVKHLFLASMDDILEAFTGVTKLNIVQKVSLRAFHSWIVAHGEIYGSLQGLNIANYTPEKREEIEVQAVHKRSAKDVKETASSVAKKIKEEFAQFTGDTKHWVAANKILLANLNSQMNENGVPLSYIVRDDHDYIDADLITMNELQRKVAQAPLNGRQFLIDSSRVFTILTTWTAGHPSNTFLETYETSQDGRKSYICLKNHYDGQHERESRCAKARQALQTAYFHQETSRFSLENYCMKMQSAYNILQQAGIHYPESEQVQMFLSKIQGNEAIKIIVLNDPECTTLEGATSKFSKLYHQSVTTKSGTVNDVLVHKTLEIPMTPTIEVAATQVVEDEKEGEDFETHVKDNVMIVTGVDVGTNEMNGIFVTGDIPTIDPGAEKELE